MKIAPFVILIAICACGCSSVPRISAWEDGPRLPQPLGGHAAALLPEGIVVAGGSNWPNGSKVWRDEIYVLERSQWKQTAKLRDGMTLPAATVQNGRLLLLGGWLAKGATGETFAYGAGQVTSAVAALPQERAQASAASIGDTLFVIGGLTDGADFKTAMASVIRLTPGESHWNEVAPLPRPLGLSATVVCNNRIYLFGGMGPDGSDTPIDSNLALRYEPAANRWTTLRPLPFARRGCAIATLDDRYILLAGGCHNVNNQPVMMRDVLIYDTRTDRYAAATPLPFAALCEQAVLDHDQLFVIGGEDFPKHRTDRVVVAHVRR